MIHLRSARDLGHRVRIMHRKRALMLLSGVSPGGDCRARRVTQTEDVYLHHLEVLLEGLELREHFNMFVVQFEFRHCVD